MKNLILLVAFGSFVTLVRAQSMGSIDDPVAGSAPTARSSDRIAFLRADIAEKQKLFARECLEAARSGNPIHHSVYQDAIKQDRLELTVLEQH